VFRLIAAEISYEHGRATSHPQVKLDRLTDAAMWWPYERTFRTGQAMQLFDFAKYNGAFVQPAEVSLGLLMATDATSMEVLTALFGVKLFRGDCASVDILRKQILRIAGSNAAARMIANQECRNGPVR
jgi:hypothetical protein